MKCFFPCLILLVCLTSPALYSQTPTPADTARIEALLRQSIEAPEDTVFFILHEALRLSQKSHYRLGEARALTYTGIEHEEKGDFNAAIPLYLASLDLYSALGDSLGIGKSYANLGAAFNRLNEKEKSTAYWEKARPLIRRYGQPGHALILLTNLVAAYSSSERPERGLALSDTAWQLAVTLHDTLQLAMIANNRGIAYEHMHQPEAALIEYRRGMEYFYVVGDADNYCRSLANMAGMLNQTGRFSEARRLLQADTADCLQMEPNIVSLHLYALIGAAAGMGDYRSAFAYQLRLKTLEDSAYTAERNRAALEVEARYETKLKDNRIRLQQTELSAQRQALWTGAAGLLLLAILIWVVWRSKRRSDSLLANILPYDTIRELKSRGRVQARRYEEVSVLFSDFKGFTRLAEQLTPEELVTEIDHCFRSFDAIIARYPIEKIKTMGDAYMCAAGLPTPDPRHAYHLVEAALDMQRFIAGFNAERTRRGQPPLPMRVGIHSGPVVAGVVGTRKFTYDIWGDTVNIAARMEEAGEADRVNISQATWERVHGDFETEYRGTLETKNKEALAMYFVAPKSTTFAAL